MKKIKWIGKYIFKIHKKLRKIILKMYILLKRAATIFGPEDSPYAVKYSKFFY